MGITLFFRKIMGKFFDSTDALFSADYCSAMKKIDSFPNPKDDYERSLFQYECTMSRLNIFKRMIIEFASLILFLPYSVKLTAAKAQKKQEYDSVIFTDRISLDTIPDSLLHRYKNIVCVPLGKGMSLNKNDWMFLKGVIQKKPFYFYFNFKTMLKLAMISNCIDSYGPKAIISYSESSFTTSLMSSFCEKKEISYIGIMHGERLFGLKLPFFRCTEYYAWDQDYIELLLSMRCEEKQFRVEVPKTLILDDYIEKTNPYYDYTFYLQDETPNSLLRLKNICKSLTNKNKRISIRPHPNASYGEYVELFPDVDVQYYKDKPLADSLSDTKYVVSKFSTVLYQAWYLKKDIVIDDVTVPELYEKLKDLGYIMLKKKHLRLSEIVE